MSGEWIASRRRLTKMTVTARALKVAILFSGQSVHLALTDRRVMLYRVIAGFCSIAFQFYAISQMVLADASVIIFTSPVITFFLVRTEGATRIATLVRNLRRGLADHELEFLGVWYREHACCASASIQ